jgi:glycosyltransferase involved in cell wall biosynthesis
MKIVAVSRVRNEEDIIEPFIRHHDMLVDAHIVLDNGSTDRTVEILRSLRNEAFNIRLFRNESTIFAETQFNTELYEIAVRDHGADWVVFLDSDEFIDPRYGTGELAPILAAVPRELTSLGLRLRNYDAPLPETNDCLNVVQRFCRRSPAEIDVWKVMVRGGVSGVTIGAGNHNIYRDGIYQAPPKQDRLVLAHYPHRSPLQWAAKAIRGRLKVLAAGQTEIRQNRSTHYNSFVEHFRRDPIAWVTMARGAVERNMQSPEMIDDPIDYLGSELRYTSPPDYGSRALRLALADAEELATALGRLIDAFPEVRQRVDADIRSFHPVV